MRRGERAWEALRNLARWDRAGATWESIGRVEGQVDALAGFDEDGPGPLPSALYAAGSFSAAGGLASNSIARWGCPLPCYANCDGSTAPPVLNVLDFVCFQARFAAGMAYADCDHSGGLNVNDFVCFQTWFAGGCP